MRDSVKRAHCLLWGPREVPGFRPVRRAAGSGSSRERFCRQRAHVCSDLMSKITRSLALMRKPYFSYISVSWHVMSLSSLTATQVKPNGQLVCWGWNCRGQCLVPEDLGPILAVSAGNAVTCAVTITHQLVCFGSNIWTPGPL